MVFQQPVLLQVKDSSQADVVHEREVFGPVSTLLTYSGQAKDAIHLIRRGGGGLVTSVYSDDRPFTTEMMMGIGNLTELTDVDSAGINTLLLGFCQETGIRSVLTTEVIYWSKSSVKECDLARALVYHAVMNKTLPKHVEPRLVTLRSGKQQLHGDDALERLALAIRDPNSLWVLIPVPTAVPP